MKGKGEQCQWRLEPETGLPGTVSNAVAWNSQSPNIAGCLAPCFREETMSPSAYYPYRSPAVRDSFLAYYDSLAAQEWPVVSEQRMVPTSYGQTFARITGPTGAPPLVLLPGAVTTSLMWAPNIQALSETYRTVAVDQIGDIGRTTCTRPVRCFNDLFTWLNELFDGLRLGPGINLAGMSFGGGLAAQYALHFPERLGRAVLLAPGATVLRLRTGFMARLIFAGIASRWYLPRLVRWMFADMARQDPQWVDATLELLFTSMRSLQRRQIPVPPVLTDAEWGGLSVPTLFLVGEHEIIYSPHKAVRRLKRVAPQIRVEVIPGAGHDLTFAQAQTVNRKILEFLRQEPAAPFGGVSSAIPIGIDSHASVPTGDRPRM